MRAHEAGIAFVSLRASFTFPRPKRAFAETFSMLSLSTVLEIDRMLQGGKLSQRQIAARLGVSRGTVGAIANGRRGLVGKEPPSDGVRSAASRALPERCPRCGHRIFLPCLICEARLYRRSRGKASRIRQPGPSRGAIQAAESQHIRR